MKQISLYEKLVSIRDALIGGDYRLDRQPLIVHQKFYNRMFMATHINSQKIENISIEESTYMPLESGEIFVCGYSIQYQFVRKDLFYGVNEKQIVHKGFYKDEIEMLLWPLNTSEYLRNVIDVFLEDNEIIECIIENIDEYLDKIPMLEKEPEVLYIGGMMEYNQIYRNDMDSSYEYDIYIEEEYEEVKYEEDEYEEYEYEEDEYKEDEYDEDE